MVVNSIKELCKFINNAQEYIVIVKNAVMSADKTRVLCVWEKKE